VADGHSDPRLVRCGVERAWVRLTVLDPEIMNDVKIAEFFLALESYG
jgi:hypothetical protein